MSSFEILSESSPTVLLYTLITQTLLLQIIEK